MPEWRIQSMQAAWWLPDQRVAPASDLYAAAVGAPPANTQTSGQASIAIGSLGESFFRLQCAPGRIDFFKTTLPPVGPRFPLFLDRTVALDDFRTRRRTLPVRECVRVATVVTLCAIASSKGEAVEWAARASGVDIPFPDGTDFIFQINRPTIGSDPALNRILKWSSDSLSNVDISTGELSVHRIDLAAFSIDINTIGLSQSADGILDVNAQENSFRAIDQEVERLLAGNGVSDLL